MNNWVTAFTAYLQAQGIPIDGVSGQGASATIWYQAGATAQQIAFAEAAKLTFVVPATPDMAGFILAVNSDALVTANAALMFELASNLLPLLESDLQLNPAVLQTHWNAAKTAFGGTWLTAQVQAMLLAYAATYNIPIS
jgi:hypothetical protein